MSSRVRLFVRLLVGLLVCGGTVQGQALTITGTNPNPVCAGSTIRVSYSYPTYNSAEAQTLYVYLYSAGSGSIVAQTNSVGPSGSIDVPISTNYITGSNYLLELQLTRQAGNVSLPTRVSPTSGITINAVPPTPTVRPIIVCQNTTAPPITSAVTASGQLRWYSSPTGTSPIAQPTISTATAGSQIYYVSQSDGIGCESGKATVNVTVNPQPVPPSVTPLSACQNTTAPFITSAITNSSGTLKWYSSPTSTSLSAAPVLSTATVGTTPYYVTQTNQYTCESNKASIAYTVNALPDAPTLNPSVLTYCVGTPAPSLPTNLNGNALSWYSTQTGGNRLTNLTPPTAVAGTTIYYASQTNANQCEGPRSGLTVRVDSRPISPQVTTPAPYCPDVTAAPLSAIALTGNTLRWYGTDASGGVGSATVTQPSTQNPGQSPIITTYYVSQIDGNTCESDRAGISVTVNPKPTPPSVVPLSVCQNTPDPLITSAITTSSGNLKWYSSPTSTSPIATPVLSSAVVGTITYYVSQTTSQYGCESDRAAIVYTVNALPSAPTLNPNSVFYCQGVSAPSLPTSLNGNALSWYTAQTGGNRLTSLTVQTTIVGTTIYYASQTNANQCEGPRSSFTVRVISRPASPQVTTPAPYCPDVTAAPLSATPLASNSLRWYGTDANGGGGLIQSHSALHPEPRPEPHHHHLLCQSGRW